MELTPSTIKSATGARKKNIKRVGRGNSSGRGTYSGRGGKGQTARSGGRSRAKIRGMRPLLLKIPKVRGFNSPKIRPETVTIRDLDRVAVEDKEITPAYLKKAGVISKPQNGVKIVATGRIAKKLIVRNCLASKRAVELIEKAGGSVNF